jgi:membrane protein
VKERAVELFAWGQRLGLDYRRTRSSLAAGGLAYFVALSIVPAALAFGTIAGLFLDPADVRAVLERLLERAPEELDKLAPMVDALVSTVESASASAFTITTVVSTVIAVYAASKVVVGVRMAMNTVFDVPETRSGFVERALATLATLAGLVIGVAAVIVLTLVPKILSWLGLPTSLSSGSSLVDWAILLAVLFVAVHWTIQHGPDREEKVPWNSLGVWAATLGILAATIGVGIYTRYSTSLSAAVLLFGTAIVVLLWLYLCFLALMWGAIIEADGATRRTSAAGQPPAQ